jgi:hypothetical protein
VSLGIRFPLSMISTKFTSNINPEKINIPLLD